MTVKLRKQLTKTTGKLRLTGFPSKNHLATVGGSESGATVAVTLVVVLAVIAGTAVVAQRSFDGFIGSRFQGRAKDARLTAEAGTAFIISEWNRPANRALYTGVPMNQWATTKNQCTAPSPAFDINAADSPTSDATSFANGAEVELPSGNDGTRRTFRLLRATFASNNRNNTFSITASPASTSGSSPVISQANARGFLELEIEGRIYQAGSQDPVATSRVIREFIVEPKCCDRSFGGIVPNDPDSRTNRLGNDSRTCPGLTSPLLGDLAIVTGLGGGGLTPQSGSGALSLLVGTGNDQLEQVICTPPAGATSCQGFQGSTIQTSGALPTAYTTKRIEIPDPPRFPAPILPQTPLVIGNNNTPMTITPPIDGVGTGSHDSNCKFQNEAYHCLVQSITLNGNNRTVRVDTNQYPVYLYMQDGSTNTIDIGGQGQIIHAKGAQTAPPSASDDFQIRGIPRTAGNDGTLTCPSSQSFSLTGNSTTAFFLWAPCSSTTLTGTSDWGGILWANNLNLNGNTTLRTAIPSNTGTCVTNPTAPPCSVLDDANGINVVNPIEWAARSINFTRFF
jgi:hypothetical protein